MRRYIWLIAMLCGCGLAAQTQTPAPGIVHASVPVAADASKLPAYVGLPVPDQGYVILRISKVVEGQAPHVVAQELNLSPGAVRVAKCRVLHRLRLELGDVRDHTEPA